MKENWQLKPTLRYVAYGLIALFLFIYNWHTVGGASDGAIYVEIPEEALRLRILAHSDHPRDQRLKEEVRDEVVELISRWVEEAQTLDEARQILGDKLSHLAQVVEEKVRQEGMDYGATVELGFIPFPAKLYGHRLYPAGLYEGLLITLGAGQGENWWCVLFPPLCFVDFSSGHAIKEEDRQVASPGGDGMDKMDEAWPGDGDGGEEDEGKKGEASVRVRFFVLDVWMKLKGWFSS